MFIPLLYLPKRYSSTPHTNNIQKGGRITNIDTFYTSCKLKKRDSDAIWTIDTTIQDASNASDGFAFVGLSKLLEEPVIVKILINNIRGKRERNIQRLFIEYPHRNIVQGICDLTCLDKEFRWLNPVKNQQVCTVECPKASNAGSIVSKSLKTHPLGGVLTLAQCDTKDGNTEFIVIIQEFIRNGDLSNMEPWTTSNWISVTLQLTFCVIELFKKFGFIYEDWKLRNILWDTTSDEEFVYRAYRKSWTVKTYGIRPVFTDFARSDILMTKKQDWHLAVQLSLVFDMMAYKCPNKRLHSATEKMAYQIEKRESISDILEDVEYIYRLLTEYL
jgi:hypothetical protein